MAAENIRPLSSRRLASSFPTAARRSIPLISRLSINHVTCFRWSLWELATALQEIGIRGVGLWRRRLDEFGEERARDLIRQTSLRVNTLSWAGAFTGSYGYSYQDAVNDGCAAARQAGRLGAHCLQIATGGRHGHTHNHMRRLVVDGLNEVADVAAEAGVTLAVQPMQPRYSDRWTYLHSLEAGLELLDCCNHPAIQLSLSTAQLGPGLDLPERLPQLVRRIASVQVGNPTAVDVENDPFGSGQLPIGDIIHQFIACGYRGFFELELWPNDRGGEIDSHTLVRLARNDFKRLTSEHALT